MNTIYRSAACAAIAGLYLLLGAAYALGDELAPETASTSPLTNTALEELGFSGTARATFVQNRLTGVWTMRVSGSYIGAEHAPLLSDAYVYGTDATGTKLGEMSLGQGQENSVIPSPFSLNLQIPKPDPYWASIGFGIRLTGTNGETTEVTSSRFPIIWEHPVLIDHVAGSTILNASNYYPGTIPSGIGIPHTLINGIPEGDYFAVVFFKNLIGCPTPNFSINAFRANAYWGYDVRGSMDMYSKAWSTTGGGCMQVFHVDPNKGEDWLWGALDPNSTSSAIADASGVPAFAICATKVACDTLAPENVSEPDPIPEATSTPATTTSNVLFLPGIKGSKLYMKNPLCLIPSSACAIPLWLPLADIATRELFMDEHGKSLQDVFVEEGGILASAFGYDIYTAFAHVLDTAEATGTFGAGWHWKAIAYDWRMSLDDIITNGATHDDGNIYYGESTAMPYIEQSLRELASTSPTGKVTIIAHSNGGLVAKALMQKLGDAVSTQLIDSVILVGVPQSGAPRAIGALLYGEGEGIPATGTFANVLMSPAHAREFGGSSPMAYHLLPSAKYLASKNPSYPLLDFAESTLLSKERTAYGESIDTASELHQYLLAEEGGRNVPDPKNLQAAAVLRPELLAYAEHTHDELDTWEPPSGVTVYQIGGFGIDTISGMHMYELPTRSGTSSLAYRPLFTLDGDGTVPVISAFMLRTLGNVHSLWVDLATQAVTHYSHGTLLEMPYVQNAITHILAHDLPRDAFAEQPSSTSRTRIALFLHSPATLTVTDGHGTRTRIRANGTTEAEIPGSTAGTIGTVSYLMVPGGSSYTVTVADSEEETFTLDMEDHVGDTVTASSTLAEIPSSPASVATLTIDGTIRAASPLSVDENGDGTSDISVTPIVGGVAYGPESASSTSPHEVIILPHDHPSHEPTRILGAPLAFSSSTAVTVTSDHPLHTSSLVRTAPVISTSSSISTSTDIVLPQTSSDTPQSFWGQIWNRMKKWLTVFLRILLVR